MQTEFLCKQNTREDPKLLLESYFLFCGLVFSLITTAEKNFEHLCWKTIQVVTHSVDKTQVPKTTLNFAKKLVFLFFFSLIVSTWWPSYLQRMAIKCQHFWVL